MFFVFWCIDKKDSLQFCLDICFLYVEWLNGFNVEGKLKMVGLMLNVEGKLMGSFVVIVVEDQVFVEVLVVQDFYVKVGFFEKVEIWFFNWVFNNLEV